MPKREKHQWAGQLVEVIKAIRLLSREGGASNEELEQELELGKRSVQRLKKTLCEQMHMPIQEVELLSGKHRRWQLSKNATMILPRLDSAGLNMPELLSLYVLRGLAGIYKSSSIMADIDSAFAKIGAVLLPATSHRLEKYARLFVVAPKSAKQYATSDDVIDELSACILDEKVCLVTYHAFGEDAVKKYRISPLHFFEHDGGLYLLAVTTRFGEIRTLAVERIREAEMMPQSYSYPADFNAEQFLSSAFTLYFGPQETFRIRFATRQARYITERQWAASQQIDEQDDGSIILTMQTSGSYDIKKWVLSYGGDAELLEPAWLREEIVDELKQGLENYQNKQQT